MWRANSAWRSDCALMSQTRSCLRVRSRSGDRCEGQLRSLPIGQQKRRADRRVPTFHCAATAQGPEPRQRALTQAAPAKRAGGWVVASELHRVAALSAYSQYSITCAPVTTPPFRLRIVRACLTGAPGVRRACRAGWAGAARTPAASADRGSAACEPGRQWRAPAA